MKDRRLGTLAPRAGDVARALAGRDASRLQVTGAYAANLLGLSTQVPARVVYLTDSGPRQVQIGNLQIVLRKTTPRQMATAGRISGTVIQALRWLGQGNVNDSTVAFLRSKLAPADKQRLLKDLRYAPTWVAKVMRQVAEPEGEAKGESSVERRGRSLGFDVRTKQVYPLGMAEASKSASMTNAVVAVIRNAARRHGMEAPRVFGSVAAGTSRPDSDLDLLVRLGPGRGYSDLLAFCDELEAELGRKVDVLTEDALNPFLHRGILAEAIAL